MTSLARHPRPGSRSRFRTLYLTVALGLFAGAPGGAWTAAPARDARTSVASRDRNLDPRARMAFLGLRHGPARAGDDPAGSGDPRPVDALLLGSPSPAALRSAGALRVVEGPGFATVRLPESALDAVARVAGVTCVQLARPLHSELDLSMPATGALAAHGASAPPYPGITGKGVILGFVDTGIDWTHGDFKDQAGRSRVRFLWDQTDAAGPHPALSPYGTEWTRTDLESPGVAREVDTEGHGTHVAGIAAGNGAATGNDRPAYTYVGMAPEADLVVAKTDFSSTGVIDAVNWIFQKATLLGEDAVVNLSLGSDYGPHDGTDPEEIALDALSAPGRIVVKAAGNSGADRRHGRLDVTLGRTATLAWSVPAYEPSVINYNYIDLDAWYSDQDSLAFTLLSPNGQVLGPVPVGYYTPQAVSTPDGALYAENGVEQTRNGSRHVFVEIWDPQLGQAPAAGTWTLRVDNLRSTGVARFDGWLAGYNLGDGRGTAAMQTGWDASTCVTTPGNARRVITVGAYATRSCWEALGTAGSMCYVTPPVVGSLAYFSSSGPTRDGRVKPELCAPGFGVAAALSGSCTRPAGFTVDDGVHVVEQGTSVACPHVAGAVCLLLQERPHMGPSETLSRLLAGAMRDSAVGAVPSNGWGYGKLNVAGALATPAAMVDASGTHARPRAGLALTAGPTPFRGSVRVSVSYPARGWATLRVMDVLGRVARTLQAGAVDAPGERRAAWDGRRTDGSAAPSGVYWIEARQGARVGRIKVTLVR